MTTYVQINDIQYPAIITGRLSDHEWDGRASKAITITMSYAEAVDLFVNDVEWSIAQDHEVIRELPNDNGELIPQIVIEQEIYDNSEYSLAGPITDHRDGTITIKMGKPKAEEILAMLEGVL